MIPRPLVHAAIFLAFAGTAFMLFGPRGYARTRISSLFASTPTESEPEPSSSSSSSSSSSTEGFNNPMGQNKQQADSEPEHPDFDISSLTEDEEAQRLATNPNDIPRHWGWKVLMSFVW